MLGMTLCKQLVEYFKDIMNYKFTANMETKLDEIAENKLKWNEVIRDFYTPFIETVSEAKQNMQKVLIESDTLCPNCGSKMVVRTSRFGTQFLGCSKYPECKTMLPLDKDGQTIEQNKETDEKCEKCNSPMIQKTGPYGPYLECTNENCKHRKRIIKTTGVKCPKCENGEIIFKKSKYGKVFFGCSNYPKCDFVSWYEPVNEKCPECGNILVKKITKKYKKLECSNKDCSFSKEMEE